MDKTEAEEAGASLPVPGEDAIVSAHELPGRYVTVREQGSGGIGRVILVKDLHLGREIALKELASDRTPQESTLAEGSCPGSRTPAVLRFLQEARITAQLEHPSIVPIYELGQRCDGTLYYTMKLIRGRTFGRAIAEAGSFSARLGLLANFLDLCQAMAYAHNKGIIHRDIKPSNVLLGEFGETVVIDWGLATAKGVSGVASGTPDSERRPNAAGADTRLTRYGQSLGTPRYMSPEQIRGDLPQIDERSDVYALGVILYEILTGTAPHEGKHEAELFEQVLTSEPTPVRLREPKVPAELAAICARAMNRKPEGRYANASELVGELKRFQAGALVEAYEYSSADRLRRFARRHTKLLSSLVVALLAVLTTGMFAIAGITREQAETEQALYGASINLAHNAIDNERLEEAEEALVRAPQRYRGLEWGLFHASCHPERLVLRGHRDVIEHAVYSPDGATIVTCAHDGYAFIWDAVSGRKLHELHLPDEFFHRAVWTPDGTLLILATGSERLCVYDAQAWTLLREMSGYAPAVSPDGKFLAAATQYGQVVTLHDLRSGEAVRAFPALPTHMIHIAFSHSGRQLAVADDGGSVWTWSLDSDSSWHKPGAHSPSARCVAFSPDDAVLVSVGSNPWGIVWDAQSGQELRRLEGEGGISMAAVLPDGHQLLTSGADRTVRVWNLATGQEVARHGGFSNPLEFVSPHPNGSEFITHMDSTSERMAAAIYPVVPLNERQTLRGHTGPVNCVAFSNDGLLLATGGGSWRYVNDDRILIWRTGDNSLLRAIATGHGSVHSVRFFPDGTRVAAGCQDGSACVYDVATGSLQQTFAAHNTVCRYVAISPDGMTLATAGWDGLATLWNTASGQRRATLEADPYRLDVVVFDPAGKCIATGGMSRRVKLWNAADGRRLVSLVPEHNQRVSALAFSPDGTRLLTGCDMGRVALWDIGKRCVVQTYSGHKSIVYAAAFSSDGTRIITAGKDAAIWFWDVKTGRPVMFLERHNGTVNGLALSCDDKYLASASDDATAVLWPIWPWRGTSRP